MVSMEERNLLQNLRLNDLVASTTTTHVPAWAKDSQTTLAYGTGRLPKHASQIRWQPLAGSGSAPSATHLSPSMQSLRRRIVRGEA